MQPRRILVAVSGGIAAYKVPELVRALTKAGHDVRCAMTRAAQSFVTPLVLQTLSGAPVRSELLDPSEEGEIDHIALADWAELVILAPATANTLARMTYGLADDLVSAVLLATRAPVLVAPAMNVNMWQHAATQANVATLRERGVRFVGPDAGELACGWEGEGRMSDPSIIAANADLVLGSESLAGRKVVVTAGGTREAIDTVRAITNSSSGKMGFAIASEAARRGAEVVLIAGPCDLPAAPGMRRIDVTTALEMRDAVLGEVEASDIVVKAAAVADFRPATRRDRKLKKETLGEDAGLHLDLVRNPDILEEVSRLEGAIGHRERRVVVGFAAESEDVIPAAQRKLERKGCDLIVANDVSRADAGFDVDTNAVSFVWPGGDVEELPLMTKREVASQLLDRAEKLLRER
ncbi:MAG: bifunctional phosphopantothenoylcysteine decarboxylase/phosphopantothenate--cysteine ligase CoaBC [Myxococcota bacterium]|nr:bifunctional phosphopantothenoylcysteine decarboxylase/phosphopantothenate--cysteine ligase CoaBC [Myxococcota bacterium]